MSSQGTHQVAQLDTSGLVHSGAYMMPAFAPD